jgi:integrase
MSRTLYYSLSERLLTESGLQTSSSDARRSTYCFLHTYATFRLREGVDVYFLAKQMGTSLKMIEDHYGHITPVKNADHILLGLSGWQSNQSDMVPSG